MLFSELFNFMVIKSYFVDFRGVIAPTGSAPDNNILSAYLTPLGFKHHP